MPKFLNHVVIILCCFLLFNLAIGKNYADFTVRANEFSYDMQEIFKNSFDNMNEILEWSKDDSGGKVSVENVPGETNKAVCLYPKSIGSRVEPRINRNILPALTGKVVLEARVRYHGPVPMSYIFKLRDSNNQWCNLVKSYGSGKFAIEGPMGDIIFGEYRKGFWYHIKIVLDLETKKADIYVNGYKRVAQQAISNQELANINYIRFSAVNANNNNIDSFTYIDDIAVYKMVQVPAPIVINSWLEDYRGDLANKHCAPINTSKAVIEFSEPMDQDSLNKSNITVRATNENTYLDYIPYYDLTSSKYEIRFKEALKPLTEYAIELNQGVRNLNGYSQIPGFERTGYFPVYMNGTVGTFGFHDGGIGLASLHMLHWLAEKQNNPELAALRLSFIRQGANPTIFDILWYDPMKANSTINIPLDNYFRKVETATFRSAWNDKHAIFSGLHAGTNNVSHGHLDTGTFVLDALGERWAEELGSDNYNLPGYFDWYNDGQRWTYYRMRAEGQNTLVINPDSSPDQIPDAHSSIVKFTSKKQGGFAVVDMTPAYADQVIMAKRGLMLTDQRRKLVLQDELVTKEASEIWWFMHTKAEISISDDGKSALLTKGNRRLWVEIASPGNATFQKMKAEPLASSPSPSGQNPNNGIHKLAIHLHNVEEMTLSVVFIPLNEDDSESTEIPQVIPIEEWDI